MLKILSWNIKHVAELWRTLLDSDVDIALLQEACEPPSDIASRFDVDIQPWRTEGAGQSRLWRAAVVGLKSRARIHRLTPRSIGDASPGDLAVTRLGTLAAAHIEDPDTGEKWTLISMYAPWEKPRVSTGSDWIYADASAHRLISDISVFVGQERGHRILASGDLNILYGYGENGNLYWAARYRTIFDRFAALGMNFVGPQFPNGRQANPWPDELPRDSLNVPTFHTNRQTSATATRQLDFVIASRDIANRVQTRALNLPEDWGGSDHCRIRIDMT
jgi:hypothetical protein